MVEVGDELGSVVRFGMVAEFIFRCPGAVLIGVGLSSMVYSQARGLLVRIPIAVVLAVGFEGTLDGSRSGSTSRSRSRSGSRGSAAWSDSGWLPNSSSESGSDEIQWRSVSGSDSRGWSCRHPPHGGGMAEP
jgi:hypothetical protein